MSKFTVSHVLLLIASILFLWGAFVIDHNGPGNTLVLFGVGLASFAASFFPWPSRTS